MECAPQPLVDSFGFFDFFDQFSLFGLFRRPLPGPLGIHTEPPHIPWWDQLARPARRLDSVRPKGTLAGIGGAAEYFPAAPCQGHGVFGIRTNALDSRLTGPDPTRAPDFPLGGNE